jgi:ferric-dicitrate binding protein FerR (iron transport regulator)
MSKPERLDSNTFERLLGVYGGRVERWPEAWREPLARLLESSVEARARWEEASGLDRLLDALPEVEPAPALMASIAALPARHPRPVRARWWPFHGALAPLLGWGMAAVLGVVVGVAQAPDADADLYAEDADMAALDLDDASGEESSDDWTEVSELVWGADWAAEEE